jgi:hypothetical protein
MMHPKMKRKFSDSRTMIAALFLLLWVAQPGSAVAEAPPAAVSAFNSYIGVVESRLAEQHRAQGGFLAPLTAVQQSEARLRSGELIVERLSPEDGPDFSGAMLHDWRGTLFVPRAKAQDLERLLMDFNAYPKQFPPQVLQAKELSHADEGGLHRVQAIMRIRQEHVITVVMDTTYDITFGQLDPQHGYSITRSTQISEIDSPGTSQEHALNASQEHGFLWRLNTYWSWEERDGGLYIQIESVSLTRSIPRGLGWAVGPFVESVPRESLQFTLRSASIALRK